MAEVSSAHDGAIIAMLDAGGCALREISPSRVRGDGCHAVTLTNYHPEMGLTLTVLWKNKVRSARDSCGLQITRIS